MNDPKPSEGEPTTDSDAKAEIERQAHFAEKAEEASEARLVAIEQRVTALEDAAALAIAPSTPRPPKGESMPYDQYVKLQGDQSSED